MEAAGAPLQAQRPIRLFPAILVELIVVLVILAILAAILVPALLGWIDKAKDKQYVLDARSVYMAAQALADEAYASDAIGTGDDKFTNLEAYLKDTDQQTKIKEMSDIADAEVVHVTTENPEDTTNNLKEGTHAGYVIIGMEVTVDGKTATLADGTWTISDGCSKPAPKP